MKRASMTAVAASVAAVFLLLIVVSVTLFLRPTKDAPDTGPVTLAQEGAGTEGDVEAAREQFIREHFQYGEEPRAWQQLHIRPIGTEDEVRELLSMMSWELKAPLTIEQRDRALDAVTSFVFTTGHADYDRYLDDSAARGERITEKQSDILKRLLLDREWDPDQVETMTAEQRLLAWAELYAREVPWSGWSDSGLSAIVFEAASPIELSRGARCPGETVRLSQTVGTPMTVADEALQDRLERGVKTTILDVVFFAEHERHPRLIVPYVVRFWWNAERRVWHRDLMVVNVSRADVSHYFIF